MRWTLAYEMNDMKVISKYVIHILNTNTKWLSEQLCIYLIFYERENEEVLKSNLTL